MNTCVLCFEFSMLFYMQYNTIVLPNIENMHNYHHVNLFFLYYYFSSDLFLFIYYFNANSDFDNSSISI